MIKKYKYYIVLFLGLLIGAVVLQLLLNSFYKNEKLKQQDKLSKIQSDAVLRVETGINIYATVISSIRAYIQNSKEFPSEIQFQNHLKDLVKDINFKDSIVVSWVDTSQFFKYVVTPNQIDPYHLKGINVASFRPNFEIKKLNTLMYQDTISLFDPINLREGWAGFPFNFAAKNQQGQVLGYIAPVLNVKYLLDYTYKGGHDSLFVHRFSFGNNIDFNREMIFDGTKIYNKKTDVEYYKNFNINENDFIYTDVNFYGLKLKIGSAYKTQPKLNYYFAIITYIWFILLCVFSISTLVQYRKNSRLNGLLKNAHKNIILKNKQLESHLSKIQTSIKEIHHRVKNNMQIISSLLNLQSNEQKNENIIEALNGSKRRIQSMALVHQKLYGTQDFASINVKEYIEQLVDSVESTLSGKTIIPVKNITVPNDLFFNIDTMIPLGLIINELVTNSYKYGLAINKNNSISITIQLKENDFLLTYSDSGTGISPDIDIKKSGTLGLELIEMLTGQLEGKFEYVRQNPATFFIEFKKL